MSIDELMEADANTLAKMTDAELLTYFVPYLEYVKPETGRERKSSGAKLSGANAERKSQQATMNARLAAAVKAAKQLGINLEA